MTKRLLVQEEMIEAVRQLCINDLRVKAALIYGSTMFAVISRSDQKLKEPPPTPSRGLVMRDKFLGNAQKFISHLSVPRLGAGLGVGKVRD